MGKTYCKNCDRLTEWTKDGLCPSCRRGEPPQSPDPAESKATLSKCSNCETPQSPDPRDERIAELAEMLTTPLSAFGGKSALAFLRAGDEQSEQYVSATLRRMYGGAQARVQELERQLADARSENYAKDFNELHDRHVKLVAERDQLLARVKKLDLLLSETERSLGEEQNRTRAEMTKVTALRADRDRWKDQARERKTACLAALNEVERLKRVIARELSENDDLGAEYTYVRALKEECARLKSDNVRLADGGARWAQNAEHFRKEAARLKAALENHRSCSCDIGGCYPNYQHIECDNCKVVKQALAAHSPDTSSSCSETAGTEPTCAPSQDNFPGIRCTPEQVRCLEDVARAAGWMQYPSPALAMALAALKDSGWRG